MAETQRFIKAENHIQDALKYKQPRAESERLDVPITFRILYSLEVSSLWESLLFYLSYTFLYFVIMDN